ncbi:alpha/beta hydrolase [Antrihabitans sp. YC2-6]|uniref:alpha/beta hydrolase n=1 Tax=Antrihabitans sp. YC2-6 TaxID=2799498 RepID=UPI0018F454C7|nr:alpha/beta hydrolase [Antrihabitans sp. YC2-6]MBJ8348422.1 lysophospholipase [Antrihabitans sp. YC2-6]
MSEHIEGGFTGSAGGRIYWQGWLPDSAPIGIVVISHGVAEHGGRYEHVGTRLTENGYAVYAIDHRGHGKSEGVRSNIDRVSGVVADLDTLIRATAAKHPDVPVFLLGHSMGGLIALQYLSGSAYDLRGAVIIAPAVEVEVGNIVTLTAAPILSRLLPNLGVLKLDSSEVSRDAQVVEDYDNDSLNFRGKLPARTGAEILATAQKLQSRLSNVTLPLLVLHGSDDKLVSPSSSKIVADNVASTDLTHKEYEGLYHEVLNEPEKEAVIDDVVAWLKAHN